MRFLFGHLETEHPVYKGIFLLFRRDAKTMRGVSLVLLNIICCYLEANKIFAFATF